MSNRISIFFVFCKRRLVNRRAFGWQIFYWFRMTKFFGNCIKEIIKLWNSCFNSIMYCFAMRRVNRVCWIIDIYSENQQIKRYKICITARNWVFLLHKPCISWYDTRAPDSFQYPSSRCLLRQNWMRITGGLFFQK